MAGLYAVQRTLREVFSEPSTQYMAPVYQRRYVWGQEQWDRLQSDLGDVLGEASSSKFLGALVFAQQGDEQSEDVQYLIIDGQQRLTTLFIVLGVLIDAVRREGVERAQELTEKYLANAPTGGKRHIKILPSAEDRESFLAIARHLAPNAYIDVEVGRFPQNHAFDEMVRRVQQWHDAEFEGSTGEESAARVIQVLGSFKFVWIKLSEEDEPNQVFDALNTGGIKLNDLDLVRNDVFTRMKATGFAAFHEKSWSPLEKHLGPHHKQFFFPYGVARNERTKKNTLFKDLRTGWTQDKLQPDEIVDEIQTYLRPFRILVGDLNPKDLPDPARLRLERLHDMRPSSVTLPFLMPLLMHCEKSGDWTRFNKNVDYIETFLVRRAVAGLEPTGLHRLFKGLWNSSSGGDIGEVHARLSGSRTIQSPNDRRLIDATFEDDFVSRKIARYVIGQINVHAMSAQPRISEDAKKAVWASASLPRILTNPAAVRTSLSGKWDGIEYLAERAAASEAPNAYAFGIFTSRFPEPAIVAGAA